MDDLSVVKPPTGAVAYWRLMIASVLCMLMFGAVQVLLPVCLDTLGHDLHLSHEQRGLLMALRMVGLVVSLLIVGQLGEHPIKRHILFVGLVIIAAGQVLSAVAPAYGPLLWSMLVSGLGLGVVEALINPLVAQLQPRNSARALNIINGVYSLGLVVGALSTGQLLQAGHSWRLPFWLWVLPPVLCAVLYLTPRYPTITKHPGEVTVTSRMRRFLASPLFWILVAAMVLGGGEEGGLTSWTANYASEVLKASARGGALATIIYGVFMAIGRMGSGFAVERLTPIRLMIFSALACGAVTLGIGFVPTLAAAWVLFALGGLFVACFWPTLLAIASDNISTGSTSLFSLLAAFGVGGYALVPWIIGVLGDLFNLRVAVLVLPVAMVLLIVMLLIAQRYSRKNGAGQTPAKAPGPVM